MVNPVLEESKLSTQQVAAAASAPAPSPAPAVRTYETVEGDTLSHISAKFYGTGNRWQAIYEANRSVLASPSLVPVGVTLTIP